MQGIPGGQVLAKQWCWLAAGSLVFFAILGMSWWNRDSLPESFPPDLGNLDRQIGSLGAENLFPVRYQNFHTRFVNLRLRFTTEHQRWWPSWNSQEFFQVYHRLLEEGELLKQGCLEKTAAFQQKVKVAFGNEREELARLRELSRSFELKDQLPQLSAAEGFLAEAGHWLQHDQFHQAWNSLTKAGDQLESAEKVSLSYLARYSSEPQITLWREWVRETVKWSASKRKTTLVILKAPRQLLVYHNGRIVKKYSVDLGFNGLQDKLYEGDGATPEGKFRVVKKKKNGETKFHKALLLNYPTGVHTQRFRLAKSYGLIPSKRSIGGLIEIHGEGLFGEDYTSGCIALTNQAIEEIFELVGEGTPVTIIGALDLQNPVTDVQKTIQQHIQKRVNWGPIPGIDQ